MELEAIPNHILSLVQYSGALGPLPVILKGSYDVKEQALTWGHSHILEIESSFVCQKITFLNNLTGWVDKDYVANWYKKNPDK